MEDKENRFKSIANLIASSKNAVGGFKSAGSGDQRHVYVCKICGFNLFSSDALNNHLDAIHAIRKSKDCFLCGHKPCSKTFETSDLLTSHLREEHSVEKFDSCGRCGKKFARSYSVPTHCAKNPPSKIYCNPCGSELKNGKDKAVKVVKINDQNAVKSFPDVTLKIIPSIKVDPPKKSAKKVVDEPEPGTCKICQLEFPSSIALDDHLRSLHVVMFCRSCKKEFKTFVMLMNHLRREHTVQKIKFCDSCGKKFNYRRAAPIHRSTEDPRKIYCDRCVIDRRNANGEIAEVVSEKNGDKNAMKSVSGVFENIIPPVTDVDQAKSHVGVKNQEVLEENSSDSFYDAPSNTIPSDSDDDESAIGNNRTDSYLCQICQNSHASSEALNDHLSSLHAVKVGERCFSCVPCKKEFNEFEVLIDHLRLDHTVHQICSCGKCGRKFPVCHSVPTHEVRRRPSQIHCDVCTLERKDSGEETARPSKELNSRGQDTDISVNKPSVKQRATDRQNEDSHAVEVINENTTEGNASKSVPDISENVILCDNDVHQTRRDDQKNCYFCQICQHGPFSSDTLNDHFRSLHVGESGESCFACGSCEKQFTESEILINHLRRDHSVQKIKSCGLCGKKFSICHSVPTHDTEKEPSRMYCRLCLLKRSSDLSLKRKNKIADECDPKQSGSVKVGELYTCEICQKVMKSKYSLRNHKLYHHSKTLYSCEICEKKFPFQHILRRHSRTHLTEDVEHRCDVCQRVFSSKYYLQSHRRKHDGKGIHVCEKCGRHFLREESLFAHMRIHGEQGAWKRAAGASKKKTSSQDEDISAVASIQTGDDVQVLDPVTGEISAIHDADNKTKRKRKVVKTKIPCSACPRSFWNREALLKHERLFCGGANPTVCKICFRNLSTARNLARHMRIHTGEKPYLCEACGKSFTRGSYLRIHQQTHEGTRVDCGFCEKTFANANSRRIHELVQHKGGTRSAHGGRRFACAVCGNAYTTQSYLRKHQLTHGEKNFACDICDKRFWKPESVATHVKTHSLERPYACDACGKAFLLKAQLKRHLMVHTGEKPYECDICQQRFTTKEIAMNHRRIHTGERPFQCEVCQKLFISRGERNRHRRKQHNYY